MKNQRLNIRGFARLGVVFIVLLLSLAVLPDLQRPGEASFEGSVMAGGDGSIEAQREVGGPVTRQLIGPQVFNGDLREAAPSEVELPALPLPLRNIPGQEPKGSAPQSANWVDPVVQQTFGPGSMPDPLIDFAGLNLAANGSGWPPDTNGDVGPNHYIQVVNTSIGIYDKASGTNLYTGTFDSFFTGPSGTPCDNSNQGDPIVLYDASVDRWIVSDFAWVGFAPTTFYECIAVSQSGDPVSGGWFFYALQASDDLGEPFYGYINDYPKLGVWPDGWYMTANMFQDVAPGTGFGVRVWALEKAAMMAGAAANEVHFDLTYPGYASILPANLRGEAPPPGSPNYMLSVEANNMAHLWEFAVDWTTPANSTFYGPTTLTIADFAIAPSIPQPGTTQLLDSLSFRLMMQLQYRNINGAESLWANHSVATGGVVGVRWYEVGDPGGAPHIVQQGTYQPDDHYRWMGSLAVDRDGNMALGYSASSTSLYPSIRYAGRLAGEAPGILPQSEVEMTAGGGSQIIYNRWGDYSSMTVDPLDGCTFWYTNEYMGATGVNWLTRIGSFKYPSCGEPKAYIEGNVYDSASGLPVPGVPVVAQGVSQTLTVMTDVSGYYTMTLLADDYDLSAGPKEPGYPTPQTVTDIAATGGMVTTQNFYLSPAPWLISAGTAIDDSVSGGNGNGATEPGEQGILLLRGLENSGAITATHVSASVSSSTPGVFVSRDPIPYADIAAGSTLTNTTAYTFSLENSLVCGSDLDFQQVVTDSVNTYLLDFTINASLALARENAFFNDVEAGADGWTTGGSANTWAITEISSHSPTHTWTDSPGGNYPDNINSYLRTPAYDLSGVRNVQISGWYTYALEAGYDYVYLEYSLDGGSTWQPDPLAFFNGYATDWVFRTVYAPALDGQANVALRYRLQSDAGVNDDGIFIDDVALSYEPYICEYNTSVPPDAPVLLAPADGGTLSNPIIFEWERALTGGNPQGYVLTIDQTDVYTLTASVHFKELILSEGAHTWTMRAFNASGSSPETESWMLTVADPPGIPLLISPVDGSLLDNPVTFEWQDSGNGGSAQGFLFILDGNVVMTFNEPVNQAIMAVEPGPHHWQVIATNQAGQSEASELWAFRVLHRVHLPTIWRSLP